jgi:hypothetical protein
MIERNEPRRGPFSAHSAFDEEASSRGMVLYVSNEARQACTECPRGFSCLEENGDLCRISCCVDGALHFITCAHEGPCPYKHAVWERLICNCPVRREIYSKYKI